MVSNPGKGILQLNWSSHYHLLYNLEDENVGAVGWFHHFLDGDDCMSAFKSTLLSKRLLQRSPFSFKRSRMV